MSASFGFIGGVLALTALDAVVTSKGATDNVTGLLGTASTIIRHLADPTVPAIPDRAGVSGGVTGTPGTGSGPKMGVTPQPGQPFYEPGTGPNGTPYGVGTGASYGSTTVNPKTGSTSSLFT